MFLYTSAGDAIKIITYKSRRKRERERSGIEERFFLSGAVIAPHIAATAAV